VGCPGLICLTYWAGLNNYIEGSRLKGRGGRQRARLVHAIQRINDAVEVVTPGLTGTWPIMHFKDGHRVSITWFKGTLKDAYIKRNGLMANGGDFRVGTRKEDLWRYKQDRCRHPEATSSQRSRILPG
jgi:hypothetical protein